MKRYVFEYILATAMSFMLISVGITYFQDDDNLIQIAALVMEKTAPTNVTNAIGPYLQQVKDNGLISGIEGVPTHTILIVGGIICLVCLVLLYRWAKYKGDFVSRLGRILFWPAIFGTVFYFLLQFLTQQATLDTVLLSKLVDPLAYMNRGFLSVLGFFVIGLLLTYIIGPFIMRREKRSETKKAEKRHERLDSMDKELEQKGVKIR